MNTLCRDCKNRRYVRIETLEGGKGGKHWCVAYQKPVTDVKDKCVKYNLGKNRY